MIAATALANDLPSTPHPTDFRGIDGLDAIAIPAPEQSSIADFAEQTVTNSTPQPHAPIATAAKPAFVRRLEDPQVLVYAGDANQALDLL